MAAAPFSARREGGVSEAINGIDTRVRAWEHTKREDGRLARSVCFNGEMYHAFLTVFVLIVFMLIAFIKCYAK
jgi:hypothetical protein